MGTSACPGKETPPARTTGPARAATPRPVPLPPPPTTGTGSTRTRPTALPPGLGSEREGSCYW